MEHRSQGARLGYARFGEQVTEATRQGGRRSTPSEARAIRHIQAVCSIEQLLKMQRLPAKVTALIPERPGFPAIGAGVAGIPYEIVASEMAGALVGFLLDAEEAYRARKS
jgi:hypothetical protein